MTRVDLTIADLAYSGPYSDQVIADHIVDRAIADHIVNHAIVQVHYMVRVVHYSAGPVY